VTWEPEILDECRVLGGKIYYVKAPYEMPRDNIPLVGTEVLIKGKSERIVAVERFMPGYPIREGEQIGLLILG
jgi:hypothetical protein